MQIVTSISLTNNVYSVDVSLEAGGFTPIEADAISRFGEPLVSCGGSFTDGGDLTYVLDDNDKYFPSGFPVRQRFSLDDNADAYARTTVWRDTMKTRITAAVTALRALDIDALGKEISIVDTTP